MAMPFFALDISVEINSLDDIAFFWKLCYNIVEFTIIMLGVAEMAEYAVLGITDYLSTENYRRVIADNRLPDSIQFILPNVEMRIQPTANDSPINIHFLFDPVFADAIETRFFSKLSFRYASTEFSAEKSELIRLGRTVDMTLNDDVAYKKGIEQFVLPLDSIKEVFEKDAELREHVIIVVSNSTTDGVSGAAGHPSYCEDGTSQLTAFRRSVYHFVDAIFSANPNEIAYFLGKKLGCLPDTVIRHCGSLKPCFHGCDAHETTRIFEPDGGRYCWVQADPTFNGLKQVLYEPEERVHIGQTESGEKEGCRIIDRLVFDEKDFQIELVVFSKQLTCIIGGKSTGKSILLHNLAWAIDQPQVRRKLEEANTGAWSLDGVTVFWADGFQSTIRLAPP